MSCWADRAADRPSFEILAVALCTVDVCQLPLTVGPLHSASCRVSQRSLDNLAPAISGRQSKAEVKSLLTRADGQASTAADVRKGALTIAHSLESLVGLRYTAAGGESARNGSKFISQPSIAGKGPIECLQASMSMESASAGPVASDDGQTLSKPSPSTPKSSAGRPVAKETKQRRGGRLAAAKRRGPPQRSAANDAADPDIRNRRGVIGDKAGSRAGRRKRGGLELVWSLAVAALAVMCIMAATVMLEPHSLVENLLVASSKGHAVIVRLGSLRHS